VPERDWQNSICGEYLVPHQPWAVDVPKTFEALQIKRAVIMTQFMLTANPPVQYEYSDAKTYAQGRMGSLRIQLFRPAVS
jgi:hypothetical protein